jgi:hypothetical protein
MATRKRIEANRKNAKKSTGPKTAEGKARSSQNAIKHGLTSRHWVLSDEDKGDFLDFSLSVQAELGAEGRLEALLAHRVALHLWRLGRIPTIEGELLERLRRGLAGKDEGLGAAWSRDAGPYGGELGRLARYETAIERNLARGLAELRRVQAARRVREREAAEAAVPPWWEAAAEAMRADMAAAHASERAPARPEPAQPEPQGQPPAGPAAEPPAVPAPAPVASRAEANLRNGANGTAANAPLGLLRALPPSPPAGSAAPCTPFESMALSPR